MVPSKAKSVGRLTKILKPDFNMNAFEDTFSSWEDEILKYEKETKTQLSDDVKIGILMTEIKGPLQQHLRLHATMVTRYQEIKEIIVNFFRIKNHYYKQEHTSTPMDIGAYWRKGKGNYFSKGGKPKGKGKYGSKGKGKGKGKYNNGFNGYNNNFKGKGPKGKTKGSIPDSQGKGKGKKGKGKGKPWCTNCQSQTHWTSKCWDRNAMQVGSVDDMVW